MNEGIKFVLWPVLAFIIGIPVIGFGMYALLGFTSYLFSDPFDWVSRLHLEPL